MAGVGYKGSNGAKTYDANGFFFGTQDRVNRTHVQGGNIKGNYNSALGGWESTLGSYYTAGIYKTSGSYYSTGRCDASGRIADYGSVIGSISSFNYYTVSAPASMPTGISKIEGAGNYDEGTTCTAKITPTSGYIVTSINGISTDGKTGTKTLSFTVASDITISATAAKYYNISFNKNGGTGSSPSSIGPCLANASYAMPAPTKLTRAGYEFKGWSTAAGGSVEYVAGASFSKSSFSAGQTFTLYAVWQAINYTCTILDGIDGSALTTVTVNYNQTLPSLQSVVQSGGAVTRAGYSLRGIYAISSYTSPPTPELNAAFWQGDGSVANGRKWPLTNNGYVVAVWTVKTYNFAIHPNGGAWEDGYESTQQDGSRPFANPSLTFNAANWCSLAGRKCVKSGSTFLGFFTAASGGVQVYDKNGDCVEGAYWHYDGSQWHYVHDGDMYLYAQYGTASSVFFEVAADESDTADGASLPESADASLLQATNPPEDGFYPPGTEFTASITTPTGWKPVKAVFYDDQSVGRGTQDLSADATTFNFGGSGFTYNLHVRVVFTRNEYDIEAKAYQDGKGEDGAHLNDDAFSDVSVTKDNAEVTKGKIGDELVFAAVLEDGYDFAGWCDESGNIVVAAADCDVSEGAYSYTATVGSADLKLYARAKVSVTFVIGYPNDTADAGKTCSLSVDGETLIAAGDESATPIDVLLGDSLEYALAVGAQSLGGADWGFDGWFSDGSVVAMPRTGTLTPSADASYTAVFVVDATKTLEIYVYVHTGESTNTLLGSSAAEALLSFRGNVSAPASSSSPRPILGGGPNAVEKTVNGTQYVNVTAAADCTYGGTAYSFHSFAKDFTDIETDLPDDSDILAKNPSYTFQLNEDRKAEDGKALYVFYGEASLVEVGLGRIGELNSGSFEIAAITSDAQGTTPATGQGESIATGGQSAHVLQGHYIKVRAVANNGYRFAGWYWDGQSMGAPDYADAESIVKVGATSTLYAKFEQDRHSICEWEGSAVNKVMEWRSKTYSAPQPFNPSGCRVDATGYAPDAALVLHVEMFSSPDAEPTATATLPEPITGIGAITSQDARRLPIRRRERFMRVCVKSDAEVDGIFIATSMGGLAT